MDSHQIIAIDFAQYQFNKLSNDELDGIVWNTSLGLATFDALHFADNDKDFLLTDEFFTIQSGYDKEHLNTYTDKTLFSHIREQVRKAFFSTDYNFRNREILEHKDLLLDFFVDISNISDIDVRFPTYSALKNFKTLDGTISLPSVALKSIDVIGPVTLISKS